MQVWWRQREQLVNDAKWADLTLQQQFSLTRLRAEFICFQDAPNKVAPFGDLYSLSGFGLVFPSLNTLQGGLLVVFQQRRLFREAALCHFGAEYAISIDVFKRQGQWMASVIDILFMRLIGECVVPSNSLAGADNMLMAVGKRITAKVVIIDDVHYTAADPQATKPSQMLKRCLPTVEWIGQDRFHVVHNFSKNLLPSAPGFQDVLIDLRQSSVAPDSRSLAAIRTALLGGTLKKRCHFKGHDFSTSELESILTTEGKMQKIQQWEVLLPTALAPASASHTASHTATGSPTTSGASPSCVCSHPHLTLICDGAMSGKWPSARVLLKDSVLAA